MRIRVSPKEALKQIDALIKEGDGLLNFIEDDYCAQQEKSDKERKQQEKEIAEKIAKADPISRLGLEALQYKKSQSLIFAGVPHEVIELYEEKYIKWGRKVVNTIKATNADFAPVYSFSRATREVPRENFLFPIVHRFKELKATMEAKLEVLVDFYNEIKKLVASPLIYLPEKSQIWFYDFVCQLKAETNESELCRFMFQFSIGEWKESAEIYAFIKGGTVDNQDEWPKNWSSVVKSAYDGVNGETNKIFGFPVFRRNKIVLCLNLPNSFLKGQK